jgi:predicted RND superfamily exporter protein
MLLGRFIGFNMRYPRAVIVAVAVMTIAAVSFIPRIQIDTDPENMLPPEQAARVFHNEVKKDFTLWDMIVVGVVNAKHPDGIFNPTTLTRVHDLTREIQKIDGVVRQDLMSLSSVDNISQDGPGVVRFEWMMAEAPRTPEEAHAIRDAAKRLPNIDGTIVSEDNRAVGIYVPIDDKNEGHRIATEIEKVIAGYTGDEEYFITGLPVADDTFGVEMFRQTGISASLAGLLTIVFIPAYVVRLSDARIAKLKRGAGAHAHDNHPLARLLRGLGPRTLADIVKTVHRKLREGDGRYYSIPGTSNAVAQTLLSYQSSRRPQDLWHFTTPDQCSAMM